MYICIYIVEASSGESKMEQINSTSEETIHKNGSNHGGGVDMDEHEAAGVLA